MPAISHNPSTIAAPVGKYSQGIEVSADMRLLYISGQIPEHADGSIPAGFAGQCEAIWRNIGEILSSANMDFSHLIKVTTYLTHADQIDTNSAIRQQHLGSARPALTVIIAQTLEPRWLLEIEAIAAR